MGFMKTKGTSLVITGILLAVFNVIAFVLPFERGETFWVGYSFITTAIILTMIVVLFVLKREGLKSKFYGVPLVYVSWTYLVIQTIVGFIEMLISAIPYQYPLVINTIMLGACLIGLISVNVGKEEIERIDEKLKEKVFFIKSLQAEVEVLISHTSNDLLKNNLKDLADVFRYSDPMSAPQLTAIENNIEIKINELSTALNKNDDETAISITDELQQMISERNQQCKLYK